jgi:hypothetical protein
MPQQLTTPLTQYIDLAFRVHAFGFLIECNGIGGTFSRLSCFDERSDIDINFGEFLPQ